MDIVSDDCLVSILSNLPVDDLNTVALCNRRFRDARSSDSLDQTHTGTFILSEGSTALSLFNAVVENNWKDVFAGNKKKRSLCESNICDTRSPLPSLQSCWRERSYLESLFSMPLSLTMNDSCVG
jgi:hypothetical protein